MKQYVIDLNSDKRRLIAGPCPDSIKIEEALLKWFKNPRGDISGLLMLSIDDEGQMKTGRLSEDYLLNVEWKAHGFPGESFFEMEERAWRDKRSRPLTLTREDRLKMITNHARDRAKDIADYFEPQDIPADPKAWGAGMVKWMLRVAGLSGDAEAREVLLNIMAPTYPVIDALKAKRDEDRKAKRKAKRG